MAGVTGRHSDAAHPGWQGAPGTHRLAERPSWNWHLGETAPATTPRPAGVATAFRAITSPPTMSLPSYPDAAEFPSSATPAAKASDQTADPIGG